MNEQTNKIDFLWRTEPINGLRCFKAVSNRAKAIQSLKYQISFTEFFVQDTFMETHPEFTYQETTEELIRKS